MNPHKEFITDEASGIEVKNQRYLDYQQGVREGITMYAWWKDGVQYVGTTVTTLKQALKEEGDGS